jgi:glycosyltransferase involved in cell wall biosynthesis
MSRVFYISRTDLSDSPYPEVTLPVLARAGHELTIAAPNASKSLYRSHLPFPSEVIDLPCGTSVGSELAVMKRLLAARFGRYDVIYVNSQSMSLRAAIGLTGPKLGKKIVYHNPDYYSPADFPLSARLERRLCRQCDLYVNVEFHRAYITSVMYGCRCPVITCPPNLPRAWPIAAPCEEKRFRMTGGDPDAFVLMMHGGYSEIRMSPQLIEALASLPAHIRLVMTGKPQTRDKVDDIFDQLGLARRVLRLPRIDFDEMLSYTVNADAAVLLYQNSDLGNFFTAPGRLTEYLICGLPLLASNHTGLENLVLRFQAGETADSTEPRSIAAAITRLERGVRQNSFPRARMRSIFDQHLAFDHWEPVFAGAFEQMLRGGGDHSDRRPPFPWLTSS